MEPRAKVYFNKDLIWDNPRVVFLNPILWTYPESIRWHDEKQVKERTKKGKDEIQFSSLEECDLIIYPKFFKLDLFNELKKVSKQAQNAGKKVVVFYVSDIDTDIKIDNLLVFRTSITSDNRENEFAMPGFPGDALETYGNNNISFNRPISSTYKISVGYAWYSNFYNIKTHIFYICLQIARKIMSLWVIKNLLYQRHKEVSYHLLSTIGIGKYVRGKVINRLKMTKTITFDFIQRKWWLYLNTWKKIKQEYIDNIIQNDFALVMRGNGNYSFRLYEIMGLGKIPVFIDTECRLPFEDIIPYKELFVRVPFKDIKHIEKYIEDFMVENHNKIHTIQKEIRDIYEKCFTINSYFKTIIEKILIK